MTKAAIFCSLEPYGVVTLQQFGCMWMNPYGASDASREASVVELCGGGGGGSERSEVSLQPSEARGAYTRGVLGGGGGGGGAPENFKF